MRGATRHRQELDPAQPPASETVPRRVRYDNPELRDALAAEYVLGTMPIRSRRRLERLIAGDPAWAQAIDAWADRLGSDRRSDAVRAAAAAGMACDRS
jgi:anti-sigma-K factor RskA